MKFNIEEIFIGYNKYPGMPISKTEIISEGIPYKVFDGYTCIKKEDYENKILPIINRG